MRIGLIVRILLFCLIAAVLLSSCSSNPRSPIEIWIDSPLPGGRVFPAEEVIIQTHAYAASGVKEMELAVDGVVLLRASPSIAGDLVTFQTTWMASDPGTHLIMVTGFSADGNQSIPRIVAIEVLGQSTATPIQSTEESVITATQTLTASPEYTVTSTATLPPPTPTATPIPAPLVSFSADQEDLTSGDCTFLRWQTQFADRTTLDGAVVSDTDARQVCPNASTTYTLRAESAGGEVVRTVKVIVASLPTPDTDGPSITGVQIEPNKIFDSPSCGVDRAQITVKASDPGAGIKRVDLYYQVVTSKTGDLVSLKMNGSQSEGYTLYLGQSELTRSLALYGGGTVRFYLIVEDNAGNQTMSKTFSFQTEVCLL